MSSSINAEFSCNWASCWVKYMMSLISQLCQPWSVVSLPPWSTTPEPWWPHACDWSKPTAHSWSCFCCTSPGRWTDPTDHKSQLFAQVHPLPDGLSHECRSYPIYIDDSFHLNHRWIRSYASGSPKNQLSEDNSADAQCSCTGITSCSAEAVRISHMPGGSGRKALGIYLRREYQAIKNEAFPFLSECDMLPGNLMCRHYFSQFTMEYLLIMHFKRGSCPELTY